MVGGRDLAFEDGRDTGVVSTSLIGADRGGSHSLENSAAGGMRSAPRDHAEAAHRAR